MAKFLLITITVISSTLLFAGTGMRKPKSFSSPSQSPSSGAISIYQRYISPVNGNNCQMQPSCSHYTQESIKRYGLLKGALMGTDRIMRCGLDTKNYPRLYVYQRWYFLDPPLWGAGY